MPFIYWFGGIYYMKHNFIYLLTYLPNNRTLWIPNWKIYILANFTTIGQSSSKRQNIVQCIAVKLTQVRQFAHWVFSLTSVSRYPELLVACYWARCTGICHGSNGQDQGRCEGLNCWYIHNLYLNTGGVSLTAPVQIYDDINIFIPTR